MRVLCGLLLFGILSTAAAGCLSPPPFDEAAWQQQVAATRRAALYAPHRRPEGGFFNPWLPQRPKTLWQVARWKLTHTPLPPGSEAFDAAPRKENPGAYLRDRQAPDSVTWVGHASFLIQLSGTVVVTDPFYSQRAWLVPRKVAPSPPLSAVPGGAVGLISHNHYDHLDTWSLERLGPRLTWLCPLGLGDFLRRHGARKVRELDWWQSAQVGGLTFVCLPAQHWSRRWGQGYNQTLWCMWLVIGPRHQVLYGGDSGYFKGFSEVGRKWPGIDLAILGVGAYIPRWFMHYVHMDIPETLRAFKELGARRLLPSQWGVLKLGDEPAAWPAEALRRAAAADARLKKALVLLPVGGRLLLK